MDFISAIRKKVNPEEHTTGAKMRKIRIMKDISAKEIGKATGVNDMAIRNYEVGKRQANKERLECISKSLGVDLSALKNREVENYVDVMHIFFELETDYAIAPCELSSYPFYGIASKSDILTMAIKEWDNKRQEWESQKISTEEYLDWKNSFPESVSDVDMESELRPAKQPRDIMQQYETKMAFEKITYTVDDAVELIENCIKNKDSADALYHLSRLKSRVDGIVAAETKKLQ